MGARLSIAVITRNAATHLDRCLASVAWAPEIVVVDSGSTDRTLEIARQFTDHVHTRPWPGFVEQKNFALEHTHQEWVLSLDADEWLTPDGAAEIREALDRPRADAYAFNRRTTFCGRFLDHVWSRDWQVRLFRRECGRFAGGQVHESVRLVPGARVARMRHRLLHDAYASIHDYVERMNRYTDLAAASLHEASRPVPWARLAISPGATFLKLYLVRRGFLDGLRGLVVSAGSAYYVLLKYAKLAERSWGPEGRDTPSGPQSP